MAEMNFNPAEVPEDERGPMEALPPGRYTLQVVESDCVPTKNAVQLSDGSWSAMILKLTHEVQGGTMDRRKLWSQHNYVNPNADAQRIGQREIADLCVAIGHDGPLTDSNQLHGYPFTAAVGVEQGQNGEPRNTVKKFKSPGGAPVAAAPRPAVVATAARPAAAAARPAAAAAAPGGRPAFLSRGAAATAR